MNFDTLDTFLEKVRGKLDSMYPEMESPLRILSQQVKLTEEVGELSEVLLKRSWGHIHSKWEHTKEDIADEIADVIITIAWIAHELDISLDTAIENKIQKIEHKWERQDT